MNESEAIEKLKSMREAEAPQEELAEPSEALEATEQEAEEAPEASEVLNKGQQAETETQEAEPETETVELEADQFAELLGLDTERLLIDDKGVKFKAKVGEDAVDVTLEQLINAYQGDANLTNRSKEVAKLEKQKQSELQEFITQKQQFAEVAAGLLETLKNEYIPQYSKEQLKQLREDDPSEYAAVIADVRERESKFNQLVNHAIGAVNKGQETQTVETQKQYQQYLNYQREQLTKSVPQWDEVKGDVKNYLNSSGFEDNDINSIVDARLLSMAYKAMMFDKGTEGAKKKLAKKIPKLIKPGTKPGKNEMSIEMAKKHHDQLKKTGNPTDAVALLRAMRK